MIPHHPHGRLLAHLPILRAFLWCERLLKYLFRYAEYVSLVIIFLTGELLRIAQYFHNHHSYQLILAIHILSGSFLAIALINRFIGYLTRLLLKRPQKTAPLSFLFKFTLTLLVFSGGLRVLQLQTNLHIPLWPAPFHGILSPYAWILALLLLKKHFGTKK